MKNTHTHYTFFRSSVSSTKEHRLMHEWKAGERGPKGAAGEAEKAAKVEKDAYVKKELVAAEKLSVDQKKERQEFLSDLHDTDDGRIEAEQKMNIKFGKDEDGELTVVGNPTKKMLEVWLKNTIDNRDGTFTLQNKVGAKTVSIILDESTYETLKTYASIKLDQLPTIYKQKIPDAAVQRDVFITQYMKEALQHPSMLMMQNAEGPAKFGLKYGEMVTAVLAKYPDAIQYVMTEWADANKAKYIEMWRKAVDTQPSMIKHLDTAKINTLGNIEYTALCVLAIGRDVNALSHVNFGSLTDPQAEAIVRLSVQKGADKDLLSNLPNNVRTIVANDKTRTRQMNEKLSPVTNEEKSLYESADFWTLASFDSVIEQVQARPRIITLVAESWPSNDIENYKKAWETAATEFPAIVGDAKTYPLLKKHLKPAAAAEFYKKLVTGAVQQFNVDDERREDGSNLIPFINAEWSREHPDTFRELFVKNGEPTGKSSLLMLLTVDGAKKAFNNANPRKADSLGYAKTLVIAMNEENLATVLAYRRNYPEILQEELKVLPNGMDTYNDVLARTLRNHPELNNNLNGINKGTLDARFGDRTQIVQALSNNVNIFNGIALPELEKHKGTIIGIILDTKEDADIVRRLFNQLPAEWKTDSEVQSIVSQNASVYKLLSNTQKENVPILKAALAADLVGKGSIDWAVDTTRYTRVRLGDKKPTKVAEVDKLIVTVEKKVELKSGVDLLDAETINAMDAKTALKLMEDDSNGAVAVLNSLIQKKAPIATDLEFLKKAAIEYNSVLQYLITSKEAQAIRDNGTITVVVLAAIENNVRNFRSLPDDLKTNQTYILAGLKKWGASFISKENFGTNEATAAALGSIYLQQDAAGRKALALKCTPDVYTLLPINTPEEVEVKTSILFINPRLGPSVLEQPQLVMFIEELLDLEQTPEQISAIKFNTMSLDAKSAASLVLHKSKAYEYLPMLLQQNPNVLEVMIANNSPHTKLIEKNLETYFASGAFDKNKNKKEFPNIAAAYENKLIMQFSESPKFDELVVTAERKKQELALYGDTAVSLETRPAFKQNLERWVTFMNGQNREGLNAQTTDKDSAKLLEKNMAIIESVFNVKDVIASGKMNWTWEALQSKVTQPSQAILLVTEVAQRVSLLKEIAFKKSVKPDEKVALEALREHHLQNISLIIDKLAFMKNLPKDTVDAFKVIETTTMNGDLVKKVNDAKRLVEFNAQ